MAAQWEFRPLVDNYACAAWFEKFLTPLTKFWEYVSIIVPRVIEQELGEVEPTAE